MVVLFLPVYLCLNSKLKSGSIRANVDQMSTDRYSVLKYQGVDNISTINTTRRYRYQREGSKVEER